MLPLNEREEQEDTNNFKTQLLEDFVKEQKARIESRKLIGELLLFAGCQLLSVSMALILFKFAIRFWITVTLIWCIALAPTLPDLCEISLNKEDGEWRITLMNRPVKTVITLVVGVVTTSVGIREVYEQLVLTQEGINKVRQEWEAYERPVSSNYQLDAFTTLVAAMVVVTIWFFWKHRNNNPFD